MNEVLDEEGNVCRTFAQRWHLDREHIQAIEEIGPEGTLGDRRLEVSIRRGNHADVNADGAAAANSLELAFLQDAKKRDLCLRWQLADFVEKDCAPIGQLEFPLSTLKSTSKCPSFMTEQFRGDERRGDRGAIHRHKRACRARRTLVNRASDELLARSRFTGDEHGGICGCDPGDLLHHRFDRV